jgi:predicted pyridoxine 5'-phosphate oxidase superfamily flavin-nucleotide-binding protein
MGILNDDMKRVVGEQKLGFVATVSPDGKPNLSPKGTTAVWDDDHLVFLDIHSPQTVANLKANRAIEINVVDVVLRKGYRFKGAATALSKGVLFDAIADFYRQRGSTSRYSHIVLVKVEAAAALISPAYDDGRSEAEVASQWLRHWDDLRGR